MIHPIAPFGPAPVPVSPRVDRAVRTSPPAVCSHVRRAIVSVCVCIRGISSNRCTRTFVDEVSKYTGAAAAATAATADAADATASAAAAFGGGEAAAAS